MKKHKKLKLKKQTVANLEKSHLHQIHGGIDVAKTFLCITVSELFTACGCTETPSCNGTCFGMNTCHTCQIK